MADEQENITTSEDGGEGAGSATDTGQHDEAAAGLGDGGKKALAEERRARTAAERQAKAAAKQLGELQTRLKEYEDAQKSDLDKLTERATAAERQAATAQARLLRYEVAAAKKLPPGWAGRLQGTSKEELEADADALLEQLGESQARQTPGYDGGVRQTARPTDMNALIRQAAGRG
jgi:hypothetical protein